MGDKKEKREDLPKLDVPKDYEPLTNVSVDRRNERYFRDFEDEE